LYCVLIPLLENPLLGTLLEIAVDPPSKCLAGSPVLAVNPLCPLPDVFPLPDPGPRPSIFLGILEPLIGFKLFNLK